MYRIRSASGNEVSYNSLEEFSAAVRRGEVHPEDEIFHTRANRWLDVRSHPHYRSATTWQHHEPTAAATAPRAPGSAGTPAAPVKPAPGSSASKAQVFERPVVRSAPQTTLRPQLQVAAAPAPQAAPEQPAPKAEADPPKLRKSRELSFIDVGDVPGTKPLPSMVQPKQPEPLPEAVTVAEAPVVAKDPPAPPAPPKVTVAPAASPPPVATAAPEAVAPVAPIAPATPAASADPALPVAVAPSVAPAAPPAPSEPVAAAAPTPPPLPETEVEFLVMDSGLESPVRTSAGYKTVPEDLSLLFDAPLPKTDGTPARASSPAAETGPASEPARSARAEKSTPASRAAQVDSDVEILPASLLEAPIPAPAPRPAPMARSSNKMLLGGGAAIVLIAAGLLAWRPWKSAGASADPVTTVATAAAQTPAPAAQPTPMVGPPAPTPIRTPSSASVPQGKSGDVAARTDTAEEQVIAVKKPSFRPDMAVPAPTDLNLGPAAGSTSSTGPSELVQNLVAAERQAQVELNTRLAVVGFRNLLAPDHLTSAGGVASARAAWTTGADAIRQYRGRIARLETAYEDSVLSSQRSRRWSGDEMRAWATRPSLAEPTETSQLADLMFSQVNEGLDILAALSGEYSVKGKTIAFKNTASATRYTSIRGWVEQRTSSWAGTPESARPYSVTAILRALGDGFPATQ